MKLHFCCACFPARQIWTEHAPRATRRIYEVLRPTAINPKTNISKQTGGRRNQILRPLSLSYLKTVTSFLSSLLILYTSDKTCIFAITYILSSDCLKIQSSIVHIPTNWFFSFLARFTSVRFSKIVDSAFTPENIQE